jgi:hypothetical protein
MLLPLIGLAIPLMKLVPPAYRWRIRRRLLRLYGELEQLDPLVNPVRNDDDLAARLKSLDRLDSGSVIKLVPKSYTDDVYKLRLLHGRCLQAAAGYRSCPAPAQRRR